MGKSQLSEGLERKRFMCHESGSGQMCLRLRKQTCIAWKRDLEKHTVGDEVGEPIRCRKVSAFYSSKDRSHW